MVRQLRQDFTCPYRNVERPELQNEALAEVFQTLFIEKRPPVLFQAGAANEGACGFQRGVLETKECQTAA